MHDRLQHALETLWSIVLLYSGLWFVLQRLKRPSVVILAYHRVIAGEATAWAFPERCISNHTFERQLVALKRHYDFVSLSDLEGILAGTRRLRRQAILLTFDDGYRDLHAEALPILRRHDIPALCFLSLGFVEERRSFWFDRLAEGIDTWDREPERRRRLHPLLPPPLAAALAAQAPRTERLQRAVAFLGRLPVRERRALMKRLLPELLPERSQAEAEALTWREVRDLREQGFSMGAHGCSHTQLTRLSPEEAWREVQDSLRGVARGSGTPVDAFAYPHGAVNDEIIRWVGQAGVRFAFTLEPREVRPGDDPLRLGRRIVCEDSSRGLRGRFSLARFLCGVSGLLPAVSAPRPGRSGRGAARLELAWTGPQEASARLEAASGVRPGPERPVGAPSVTNRGARWTEHRANH